MASLLNDSELWWLNIVGRAKPGVLDAQAQAALDVELAAATGQRSRSSPAKQCRDWCWPMAAAD
jgi:hypothetical protein